MKFTKILFGLLLIALLALAFALPAPAQPYYTNAYTTNGMFGTANYNDKVIPANQPGNTRALQYILGLSYGSITNLAGGSNVITFPTNYLYSIPPTVIIQPYGIAGTAAGLTTNIVLVTTTNAYYFNGLATPTTNNYIILGR